MKSPKIWAYSGLIAVFLAVFFICVHLRNQTHQTLAVWQSNPALGSSLGQEVTQQGYGMRLPNGYEPAYADLLGNLQPFGLDMYMWHNDRHEPNASGISLGVVRRMNLQTPTHTAKIALESEKEDMDNFVSSPIEEGEINGIPFARVYYQETKKGSSSLDVTSGFIYAMTDWTKGIIVDGYDKVPCTSEPCHYAPMGQPVLPSVEAAILTFHKL